MKTWRQIFESEGEYENIIKLLELCFVIPLFNAIVERLFSRMKRVKSSKRGSMSNSRLETLLRIGETGETLTKSTVVSAMKLWDEKKQRRPSQVVPRVYRKRRPGNRKNDNRVDTNVSLHCYLSCSYKKFVHYHLSQCKMLWP